MATPKQLAGSDAFPRGDVATADPNMNSEGAGGDDTPREAAETVVQWADALIPECYAYRWRWATAGRVVFAPFAAYSPETLFANGLEALAGLKTPWSGRRPAPGEFVCLEVTAWLTEAALARPGEYECECERGRECECGWETLVESVPAWNLSEAGDWLDEAAGRLWERRPLPF